MLESFCVTICESFCVTICESLICARFDDTANKEINKTLVQIVMAVNTDDQVTPCIVKHKTYCTFVLFQILFGLQVRYVFILSQRRASIHIRERENTKK